MKQPARLTRRLGAVTIAAIALLSAPAVAEPVAVIAAYGGARPAEADELVTPLFATLGRGDYLWGAPLNRLVEARVSQPGSHPEARTAEAIQRADRGYEHWLDGDFKQATNELERAVELFHDNPALFATRADERQLLYKTLIALAVSHARLGHSERAVSVMAELVRSFPDTPFNRALFPPDAHDLYRKVRADVLAQRTGRLRIQVNDDSVTILLNERFVAAGGAYDAELPPGNRTSSSTIQPTQPVD